MVLHILMWSQCAHGMVNAELGVLARPGIGEVQQWTVLSAPTPGS